jgi:hypothetical protein
MQNISLLYDFEIDSIAQEKSLSLLPLIHHALSNWPDADWDDISYTISEHVKEHGFGGLPTELLTSPEVEDIQIDLPPHSDAEDFSDLPDLDLFDSDDEPELEVENVNVLIQPKRVERLVDVREILQQVKRGNL